MNTSVNKASNKRKSFGGKNNTPAKVAKLNVSLSSPKTEATNEKSPKKVDKKGNKAQNGVGPKLENFKGIKSLEPKTENADSETKKSKTKKPRGIQNKKVYLLEQMKKRVETEGKEAVIKELNQKIDAIASKTEPITKTTKRTLRSYKFILNTISGEIKVTAPQATKKQNKKVEAKKVVPTKEDKKPVQKVENKKANAKQNKVNKPVKTEEEEDKEDESDEETSFKDVQNDEFKDDSAEEDSGEEEEVSGEEDSDDEEDDDEEESDETEVTEKKVEPKKVIKKEVATPQQKKSRYVLFVGNLAYDTTKDEIKEHFKKVGEVVDVRIPTDRESNRPRGFAYVEVIDEAAYQKSLTLNGSQLKNRKIRVDYTQGPNKNSEERNKNMKAKNFKLHAMTKKGQRGGPKNGSPFKGRNKK